MSDLSRTPPADRRSSEQDRDAEIGNIYNAQTSQLVLDSEEIAATRLPPVDHIHESFLEWFEYVGQ